MHAHEERMSTSGEVSRGSGYVVAQVFDSFGSTVEMTTLESLCGSSRFDVETYIENSSTGLT